jgi:raffinose/stachyose/melibiose transport system substrate-binding protein
MDGKVYAFIMTPPTPFGIFYRKDIFERLGLEPPTTAEELLQVCRDIRAADPEIVPLFEAAGSGWPPYVAYMAYMGGPLHDGWLDKILTREGRLDDPESPFLGSLKFYQQLQEECHNPDALSATYEDSYRALGEGRAAMVSQHSGILLDMVGALGEESIEQVGFTSWSESGPVVTASGNPSGTFYLPKTGDPAREAAAREFIRFMSGPAYADFVVEAKQYPTLEGVPVPGDITPALVEAAELAAENGSVNTVSDFLPGLAYSPVDEVVAGTSTPEDAVVQLQLSADQGARAAGLPGWE